MATPADRDYEALKMSWSVVHVLTSNKQPTMQVVILLVVSQFSFLTE